MTEDPLKRLKKLLARLPGLGEKSGERLAYFIWKSPASYAQELAQALLEVKEKVKPCSVCGNPSTQEPCKICADPDRDRSLVMVVEEPADLEAIEKTGAYRGVYHVLGGALSPLAGVGPEDLNLESLLARVEKGGLKEVIIATNASAEGDATAAYLEQMLAAHPELAVSRLARGVPVGGKIRFLDSLSLELAVKARVKKEEK